MTPEEKLKRLERCQKSLEVLMDRIRRNSYGTELPFHLQEDENIVRDARELVAEILKVIN
jgi:hypothetical protein